MEAPLGEECEGDIEVAPSPVHEQQPTGTEPFRLHRAELNGTVHHAAALAGPTEPALPEEEPAMTQPIVTRAVDAPTFTTAPTDLMTFLACGDSEAPDVYVETMAPGDGPPLHRHPWMTWEVVVDGSIRALVGDDTYELGPGDLLFTPPDVPHTFMATGDGARIVGINWPGGFHHLYAELSPLFAAEGGPDFGEMAAAAARHDAEILGPPLAQLEAAG